MLDKETEDLVKLETPLGGVTDIVRQSLEFVAAVFRLPVTKFLGISPAGFNPTGEAERRNLYDYLASRQEKILRRPLARVLTLLQLHAFGAIDPDLTFEFAPLNPDDEGKGGGNGGGGKTKGEKSKADSPSASGGNSINGASAPQATDRRATNAFLNVDKNDFKESDHPRDKDGKFAKGGGAGSSTYTPAPAKANSILPAPAPGNALRSISRNDSNTTYLATQLKTAPPPPLMQASLQLPGWITRAFLYLFKGHD